MNYDYESDMTEFDSEENAKLEQYHHESGANREEGKMDLEQFYQPLQKFDDVISRTQDKQIKSFESHCYNVNLAYNQAATTCYQGFTMFYHKSYKSP